MSGVLVKYSGIAVNSDTSFRVSNPDWDKTDFVKDQTILDRSLTYKNIGNPCELYSVLLDGSVEAFPDNPDSENLGYWSNSISKDNGDLPDIILEFNSNQNFSSAGITITFDAQKEIFPTEVQIAWYGDSGLLASEIFNVTSGMFFFSKKVELYNYVVMSFKKLNMPQNRLKIQRVEFGLSTDSDTGFRLKNSKISQSISPISAEIPISTFNFSFASKTNVEYAFQERQTVDVLFNNALQSRFYVKNAKRKSQKDYDVSCENLFGLLDTVDFPGGIFVEKNAFELLSEIFNVAKIPTFTISSDVASETLTGYLKYSTCREALKQVLFAIQSVADTSGTTNVSIKRLPNRIVHEIPLTRLMQGINVDTETRVSAVEVTAHTYTPIDEEQIVYEGEKSGSGYGILVKFSEPLHSLEISTGTILESGENYAIINAFSTSVLKGKKYQHTTTVKSLRNPAVLSSETENIKQIPDATLVSDSNVDRVLDSCYNYFVKSETVTAKIIEAKHENESGYIYDSVVNLGDLITVDTDYQGVFEGRVENQSYSLNGGILVKDTVLR